MDDVGTDNLWAWVRAGDEQVVAAAMHTPPFGAYVSVGSDDAMRELAACFHRSGCGLPGAGGLRPQVEAFADEWVRLTGVAVEVTMRQGVYAADAVIPPTGVGDRPVSMAGATAAVGGVSRVQYVYTPPRLRGRGYASACVAALTAGELAQPGRTCMLYTDLANPTSNGIYQAVGYRRVGEATQLSFA